jgi:replicative DNA helicase
MAIPDRERILEFERAIIGCAVISNFVMDALLSEIEASDFMAAKHRVLYETMVGMYAEAKPIDLVTLHNEVDRDGNGGVVSASDIASLTTDAIQPSSLSYYVGEVKKAALRRNLLKVARGAQNQIETGEDEDSVIESMENALIELSTRSGTRGYIPAYVALMGAAKRIDEMQRGDVDMFKVQTGIRALDGLIGGLEEEDYMIIGARPSVGKSALALQMAMDMAMRQKKRVAIFSLEMGGNALMMRTLSQELRIDSKKIRQGMITQSDMERIVDFGGRLSGLKMFLNDTPNIRLSDLRSQARMIKQREGLDVIIIDYLTLITGNKRLPRWEQVTEISAALKQLGRELQTSVIALSQLSRDSDEKRPTLASLRESGAIEQDADVVLLLHRTSDVGSDLAGNPNPQSIEFIVAKDRNGPVGKVNMVFLPQYTRFEHAADRLMGE